MFKFRFPRSSIHFTLVFATLVGLSSLPAEGLPEPASGASQEAGSLSQPLRSFPPSELPEALGQASLSGLKVSCSNVSCGSLNCLDECARTLAGVLSGANPSLCDITNGRCKCQAGFGLPGSAVFADPSENKGPVCHAALYAGRNSGTDRQWWREYFDHQLLGPSGGAGFMNKEIFSPLYGSFIVASVMTALDTANQRGHTDVASRATQWLRAYWALASLASRNGNIETAWVRHRSGLSSRSPNSSYINGVTQVTAGPRALSSLGSAVGSTLHPLLTMALDVGPKVYNRGLNTSFAFYGGVRAAAELGGFSFDSSYMMTNFGSRTAPASVFGLTDAERANLAAIVRGQSHANLSAAAAMVGSYRPKCNLTFLRTTQGSISWFGTSEPGTAGEQLVCNTAKGAIFAMRYDNNETAYYLQPALESQLPSAARWTSYRDGNQICAKVDPAFAASSSDSSYSTGPWCIDMPGGQVLYEYSFTRTQGLRSVGSTNNQPSIRVQADFVGQLPPGSSLDFGQVTPQVGGHVERVIRIYNEGQASMTVSATTTNTSGNAFTQLEQPPSPIPVGENRVFRIRMSRSQSGSFAATLRIQHSAGNIASPLTIPLSGVVGSGPQTLTLTPEVDTFVLEEQPTINHATSHALRFRFNSGLGRRSFLRFRIPTHVTNIQSAQLQMRTHSAPVLEGALFKQTAGDQNWSEASRNWNNHLSPPLEYTYISSATNLPAFTWYTYDVTGFVTGPGPITFGLASGDDAADQAFFSSDSPYDPQLILIYQP